MHAFMHVENQPLLARPVRAYKALLNTFCSKSQRAGLFLHLAAGPDLPAGPDVPRDLRSRISHHQQVLQTHKETEVSPGCELFKSISKRAGKQGTDLPSCQVPGKEMEFSLRRLWPPGPSYPAEGTSRWRSSPQCQECFARRPSAVRARCTTEPVLPTPRAGGGRDSELGKAQGVSCHTSV